MSFPWIQAWENVNGRLYITAMGLVRFQTDAASIEIIPGHTSVVGGRGNRYYNACGARATGGIVRHL